VKLEERGVPLAVVAGVREYELVANRPPEGGAPR
jgi:hypothetical protein